MNPGLLIGMVMLGYSAFAGDKAQEYEIASKWFATATRIQSRDVLPKIFSHENWKCFKHYPSGHSWAISYFVDSANKKQYLISHFSKINTKFVLIEGVLLDRENPFHDIYSFKNNDLIEAYRVNGTDIPQRVIRYSESSGQLIIRDGFFEPNGSPEEDFTNSKHFGNYDFMNCIPQ